MKKAITYYIPVTLTLFMLVTIRRNVVVIDGGYSALWGFPFSYISNAFACSFCYLVFVGPLLIDLFFYFAVVFFLFKLIEKSGRPLKTHWIPLLLGLCVSLFWIYAFYAFNMDSIFHFKNEYQVKTESIQIVFGLFS